MPSPIAHAALGYVLHRVSKTLQPGASAPEPSLAPWWKPLFAPHLWLLLILSLLPDVDAVAGVIFNDMHGFHNNASHSLVVALLVGLLVGGIAWRVKRHSFWHWFTFASLAYGMHVVMDAFTYDSRGVMLFWPFTSERFLAPVTLFYGVRWGDGLLTPAHLVTIATETGFALVMVWIVSRLERKSSLGPDNLQNQVQGQPAFEPESTLAPGPTGRKQHDYKPE